MRSTEELNSDYPQTVKAGARDIVKQLNEAWFQWKRLPGDHRAVYISPELCELAADCIERLAALCESAEQVIAFAKGDNIVQAQKDRIAALETVAALARRCLDSLDGEEITLGTHPILKGLDAALKEVGK